GAARAFGPPPWSLGWQRTKGIGRIETTDFELRVTTPAGSHYAYTLRLAEKDIEAQVKEERLTRLKDKVVIASFDYGREPLSGTILRPNTSNPPNQEIQDVATVFES